MSVKIYLFDAKGFDRTLELEDVNLKKIKTNQLVWINIIGRKEQEIKESMSILGIENVPFKNIINVSERPKIEIYEGYFRFFINSIKTDRDGRQKKIPIDFLVGKNYVITIHDEVVEYFKHFTEHEKGEKHIGELDAESFIATLLDLHIVSYFEALEDIENQFDELDARVLETEIETREFLKEMVDLRKSVSNLRRWFLPHREVFYALSRPDFQQISESDSAEAFRLLNDHFENAFDAIESSRDTLNGLFELYAAKSAQLTNELVQRLTFITLIIGMLGVIAGAFGMNFETEEVFKLPFGFWLALGGMFLLAALLTIIAKLKRWI